MSITSRETSLHESAAYAALVDAIGGIATIVLAVIGLAGVNPPMITAIATIVFGVALLIQGGTMLSEFAQIVFPPEWEVGAVEQGGGSSLSVVFMGGATGVVLGILALLGIHAAMLMAASVIVFGTALLLSSNAVRHLYMLRQSVKGPRQTRFGGEMVLGEIASGSAGVQALAGLAAIVLGVLAIAGEADATLNLVALLLLGSTIFMTGGSLTATIVSFMRSA